MFYHKSNLVRYGRRAVRNIKSLSCCYIDLLLMLELIFPLLVAISVAQYVAKEASSTELNGVPALLQNHCAKRDAREKATIAIVHLNMLTCADC